MSTFNWQWRSMWNWVTVGVKLMRNTPLQVGRALTPQTRHSLQNIFFAFGLNCFYLDNAWQPARLFYYHLAAVSRWKVKECKLEQCLDHLLCARLSTEIRIKFPSSFRKAAFHSSASPLKPCRALLLRTPFSPCPLLLPLSCHIAH